MAGLIEELITFLDAAVPALTAAQNLFAYLPDTPDQCVAVQEYIGAAPVHTMGAAGAAYERPRVQLMVRDSTQVGARDLANQCMQALDAVVNQTLSGVYYLRIEALQSPFLLQRDERGPNRRVIYACNFGCDRDAP